MIIYCSILIWIIIVNNICSSVYIEDEFGHEHCSPSRAQFLLSAGSIIIIFGLRSGVADTSAHIMTFSRIPPGIEGLKYLQTANMKGTVFRLFGVLCKTITSDYHFYLLSIALVTGLLIFIPLAKKTEYYGISMVLFMLTSTYTWMLNGIRQFMAVAVCFFSYVMFRDEKPTKSFLLLLIAVGIHRSSIVMLIIFFIVQGEAWNKRTIILLLIGLLAVVFLDQSIHFLDIVTQGTEYEGYTDLFDLSTGSNPIRTIIYAIPPALAYIQREKVMEKGSSLINICINMSLVAVVISLMANFTSGIYVGAMPIYFSIYNLILLPWLLINIYDGREGAFLKAAMYFFYTIIFLMESYPYYSDILFSGRTFPRWNIF